MDAWARLRAFTPARIALGRSGSALPTPEVLAFGLAHARARDAVHLAMDVEALAAACTQLGLEVLHVRSAAADRAQFLRRPDLGRRLCAPSRRVLEDAVVRRRDLVLVLADGLSATALDNHAVPLLQSLLPQVPRALEGCACVIAEQGRVALGDEIGELLAARLALVLIGERPGLSSPDSLGLYLTYGPRVGRTDAERNCISNIRTEGLSYAGAAQKAAWLMQQAVERALTGVGLKDASVALPDAADRPAVLADPAGV